MKTVIFCIALLVIFGCASKDDKGPALPNDSVTGKIEISATQFDSIKEVQLQGLAEDTTLRVGVSNEVLVISIRGIVGAQPVFTTVSYLNPKTESEVKRETSHDKGLFESKFDAEINSSRTLDTLFSNFKQLMQVYHLKDIYRCRSSKFWSQLVDYTPDRRGPGLLRLDQELYFPVLEAEVYLVIDFKTQKLMDVEFKKTWDHFEGDYYTSGPGSQLTQSLGTFSLFCKEEYQTLKPNYVGEEFLKDIDKSASELADIHLNRYSQGKQPLDLKTMGLGNELRSLSEITSELKKHRGFMSPTHWDFYFQSIQSVRESHN